MELAVNELPTPFIRYAGNIPCFTLTEAARFLAKSDADFPRLHNQLKGAAQRGLMRHRLKGQGKTSAALFGIDDLAVSAGVLFPLFDFGLSDAEMANNASMACYAFHEMFNPKPSYIPDYVSPIAAALLGARRGEAWAFKLTDYHCDQTGNRCVVTSVYNIDVAPVPGSFILPPSYISRVSVIVQLAPLLLPLARVFKRMRLDA
jgi:hypothetical protein